MFRYIYLQRKLLIDVLVIDVNCIGCCVERFVRIPYVINRRKAFALCYKLRIVRSVIDVWNKNDYYTVRRRRHPRG
jgi:hypothetical protein